MKKLLLTALIGAFAFASCDIGGERIRGNGNTQTDERQVSDFTKVEVHGSMKVNVAQGDDRKLRIEAEENLLQYIDVNQQGDKLVIEPKDGYNLNPSQDIKVYLTAPVYKSIHVSGACDIIGEGKIDNNDKMDLHVSGAGEIKMTVDAPALEVSISGSGSVNLKGETKDFELDLSGAANARCYDLRAENTKVEISGAGDAEVFASVKLDARVSGAGSVSYKGNPGKLNQNVSGAGSVKRRD